MCNQTNNTENEAMKKITIWTIECSNDSSAYDIRAETKREAIEQLNRCGEHNAYSKTLYKRVFFGDSVFQILDDALGEMRGCWENHAEYDLTKLKGVDTQARLINY